MTLQRRGEEARSIVPVVLGWAAAAVVSAWMGVFVLVPVSNSDIGWHLAMGRLIAQTRSVPVTEPFTHTAAGAPMVAHEWLSQWLSYQGYAAAGMTGVVWLYACLTAAVVLAVYALHRRMGADVSLALFGTVVYAVIAQSRFQVRPHMFHLLLLVAFSSWIFAGRPRLRTGELLAAFVAMVLWVNLHSGAALFPGLLAVYLAAAWLQARLGWREPQRADLGAGDLRRVAALLAVCSVALVCTPNGFALVPYLLETPQVNSALSSEWLSAAHFWSRRTLLPGSLEGYAGLVLAALVTLATRRGERSLGDWAVALCFLALPIASQRFLAAVALPLALVLAEWTAALRERPDPRWLRGGSIIAVALACALAATQLPPVTDGGNLERRLSGPLGYRGDLFPSGAVDFLAAVPLGTRLYHPTRWGGYLELKLPDRYRSFSDGRWVTIGRDRIRDSLQIESRVPGALAMVDAYSVDVLVLPRGWMTDEVEGARAWLVVFQNINAAIYVRRGSSELDAVARYYAALGIPFDRERGFSERLALESNPEWAGRHRVQRTHLVLFGVSPVRAGTIKLERRNGW